jgi:hypothetical protein
MSWIFPKAYPLKQGERNGKSDFPLYSGYPVGRRKRRGAGLRYLHAWRCDQGLGQR